MTYRPEREKNGYCRIMFANGKTQDVKRNEYEPMVAAWRAGTDPWYEAIDLYGDSLTVHFVGVVEVADCSPSALAAFEADEDERRAHERAHGED